MTGYSDYGGRGIEFCARWEKFEHFLDDMGKRPSPAHTIDRIDTNGPYSKENCRWATPKEQARNRRSNRLLTFNGEALCVSEWAERLGCHYTALHERLRRGWSVERALTTPVRKLKPRK